MTCDKLYCAVGCLFALMSNSYGQTCSDDIIGGWTGTLQAERLFQVELSIQVDTNGGYSARVTSSAGDEYSAVWQDSESIRMQSIKT